MYLYKNSQDKISDDNFKYLASGTAADVFYHDEIVLKKYHLNTSSYRRLKKEVFDVLKTINHPNFIKLYDTYYELESLSSTYKKNIAAYTAEYYKNDKVNPSLQPKDYIIDNFKKLEDLFKLFSDEGIILNDIVYCNILFHNNNMIIIDPDMYMLGNGKSKDVILNHNMRALAGLFSSIYNTYLPGRNIIKPKDEYNTFTDEEMMDIPMSIERKLKPYKRLKDIYNNKF